MNDIQLLQYFVAVYQKGSFRNAADSLGVSQSTITKGVQRLEKEMGLRLFNRTTRAVQPTDNARQLIDSASASLSAMDDFMEEGRLIAGGARGALRLGVIALAADLLVADCLTVLSETHPELEVEVAIGSDDMYQDLATGRCDVAIGDEANFQASPHAPALRMVPLQHEPLVVVFREGHPGTNAPLADLLQDYSWAIPSLYFNENRLFEGFASHVSQSLRFPRYRLASLGSCLHLTSRCNVVSLAPLSLVKARKVFEWRDFDLDMDVKLAMFTIANNPPSPAINALHNALRAVG
ncbi:MAG: LysR family transcriptional regulator [Pseudomonadota bacterium]